MKTISNGRIVMPPKRYEEPKTYSDVFRAEWNSICKKLANSGADLSKIRIVKMFGKES